MFNCSKLAPVEGGNPPPNAADTTACCRWRGQYAASDPAKIRDDIGEFLEQLQQKCIVDY